MLSKQLHQFNQILHNERDHQVVVVGGPNRRPTNPCRHLEKSQKSRYLRNALTDLYKIWYADAKLVPHRSDC